MNIFYLDPDPVACAACHYDRHVVKMILESAQLLSTAHRVLDGEETVRRSPAGRRVKRWVLPDQRDGILYSATHINHPSAQWARARDGNYAWLHAMMAALCAEYTTRYEKTHKCERDALLQALATPPRAIPHLPFSPPPPVMPENLQIPGDVLASYRRYYVQGKAHLARWTGREAPEWYEAFRN